MNYLSQLPSTSAHFHELRFGTHRRTWRFTICLDYMVAVAKDVHAPLSVLCARVSADSLDGASSAQHCDNCGPTKYHAIREDCTIESAVGLSLTFEPREGC